MKEYIKIYGELHCEDNIQYIIKLIDYYGIKITRELLEEAEKRYGG